MKPAEFLQAKLPCSQMHPVTLASGMIEKVGVPLTEGMTLVLEIIMASKW